jgi:2-polyprenyl-3-methyl-5-hydroxy-6-metoxy-1,4-benzoquinol methylase
MDAQAHWEKVYAVKVPNAVSWYRPHLDTSLSLIGRVSSRNSAIIDVGGGESTLVDDLMSQGYGNVTVLDISQRAVETKKATTG